MEQRGLRRAASVACLALLLALLGIVAPAPDGGSAPHARAGQSDVVGALVGPHAALDRGTVRPAHPQSPGPGDVLVGLPTDAAPPHAGSGHLDGPAPVSAALEIDPSTRGSRAPPAFVS